MSDSELINLVLKQPGKQKLELNMVVDYSTIEKLENDGLIYELSWRPFSSWLGDNKYRIRTVTTKEKEQLMLL